MTDTHDPVNHPIHYCHGGIEAIDVIEAWELGYHLGNVIKYISRAGHKDQADYVEDLCKARWYLEREITQAGGLCDKREEEQDVNLYRHCPEPAQPIRAGQICVCGKTYEEVAIRSPNVEAEDIS